MFKVFRTDEFEKLMGKLLTPEEMLRVENIEGEIAEKGITGDPLGYPFIREKRISGKRVYFLVYEEYRAALMVSISDKKTQQATIEEIKVYLPEFKRLIGELIKFT
ncbi:hypothetical protein HYU14_02625 [Candidatus Woesearchaeota archaeon]|nr:hypothetical protein [Candidatus Woesearchaeota archaeon]